eukprot:84809-Chlamydomonas_euryale.AAC.2
MLPPPPRSSFLAFNPEQFLSGNKTHSLCRGQEVQYHDTHGRKNTKSAGVTPASVLLSLRPAALLLCFPLLRCPPVSAALLCLLLLCPPPPTGPPPERGSAVRRGGGQPGASAT